MIIDDSIHMIHIIKALLRGFGCKQTVECRDAAEAFDRLRQETIDFIIVDYQMDMLDGVDFVKLVRNSSDSSCKHIPIIMLTAHSERSRVEAARDAGVTEFCCKPVTAVELFRKISNIVDHPRHFIRTGSYFGPNRRRKVAKEYAGPERRKQNEVAV